MEWDTLEDVRLGMLMNINIEDIIYLELMLFVKPSGDSLLVVGAWISSKRFWLLYMYLGNNGRCLKC